MFHEMHGIPCLSFSFLLKRHNNHSINLEARKIWVWNLSPHIAEPGHCSQSLYTGAA